MFIAWENIVCTLKWPSLKAKIRKMKKSKFGRIDSWTCIFQHAFEFCCLALFTFHFAGAHLCLPVRFCVYRFTFIKATIPGTHIVLHFQKLIHFLKSNFQKQRYSYIRDRKNLNWNDFPFFLIRFELNLIHEMLFPY